MPPDGLMTLGIVTTVMKSSFEYLILNSHFYWIILMHLFLDLDGVLADFDVAAAQLFGMHPRTYEDTHGSHLFWSTINNHGSFFLDLPKMEHCDYLFNSVKYLRPTILTGCPFGGWAEPQKIEWVAKHLGEDVPVITCKSIDKSMHMLTSSDVIIDDWPKYQSIWEDKGGTFILYENNPIDVLLRLEELGLL
jgi:hypothetical protein